MNAKETNSDQDAAESRSIDVIFDTLNGAKASCRILAGASLVMTLLMAALFYSALTQFMHPPVLDGVLGSLVKIRFVEEGLRLSLAAVALFFASLTYLLWTHSNVVSKIQRSRDYRIEQLVESFIELLKQIVFIAIATIVFGILIFVCYFII